MYIWTNLDLFKEIQEGPFFTKSNKELINFLSTIRRENYQRDKNSRNKVEEIDF